MRHANATESVASPSVKWLNRFLAFGSALVLAITLSLGIASAVLTARGADIWGVTRPSVTSLALIGSSIVVLVLALVLCRALWKRADAINLSLLELLLAVVALLVGLWFIWCNHTETSLFNDAKVLQLFSEHLAVGDLSDFWPHVDEYAAKVYGDLYMSVYPHQAGILLLMTGLCRLFGTGMVKALEVVNLLAAIGVSALLCSFSRAVARPRGERAILALIAYGFLPDVLFCVFPYGNTIGLFLVMAAARVLLASLSASRTARAVVFGLGAFLLALAGLMVKSTYVYLVVGVVLIALLGRLSKAAYGRAALLVLCSGVVLALSSALPRVGFEALVGYALPEDQPKVTWAAIGLDYQPASDPRPGWYNPIGTENRIAHDGDVGDETSHAQDVIASQLRRMGDDPAYAAWFFSHKLAYEWLDPTYDCYFAASLNKMSEEDAARWGHGPNGTFWPWDTAQPHGYVCYALFVLMDACQTLLYLGAAAGACDLMREARHGRHGAALAEYALPCVFFIGFLLYVVWEGKSMYALPLAMCLLPIAARGISSGIARLSRRD